MSAHVIDTAPTTDQGRTARTAAICPLQPTGLIAREEIATAIAAQIMWDQMQGTMFPVMSYEIQFAR